jgi:hypothetical protein
VKHHLIAIGLGLAILVVLKIGVRRVAIALVLALAAAVAIDVLLHLGGTPDRPGLPNHALTPRPALGDVTQDNIQQTICVPGWSRGIRPPSSYTNKLKAAQILEYHYDDENLNDYEEDHLISLELGGHPTDPRNLWPEPYYGPCGAHIKDAVENKLHRMVCNGDLTLKQAQDAISTDWVAAYKLYVHSEGCL